MSDKETPFSLFQLRRLVTHSGYVLQYRERICFNRYLGFVPTYTWGEWKDVPDIFEGKDNE